MENCIRECKNLNLQDSYTKEYKYLNLQFLHVGIKVDVKHVDTYVNIAYVECLLLKINILLLRLTTIQCYARQAKMPTEWRELLKCFTHLLISCVCNMLIYTCYRYMWSFQDKVQSRFSPPTVSVLDIKLRSPDSAAGTFTPCVISPALMWVFTFKSVLNLIRRTAEESQAKGQFQRPIKHDRTTGLFLTSRQKLFQ